MDAITCAVHMARALSQILEESCGGSRIVFTSAEDLPVRCTIYAPVAGPLRQHPALAASKVGSVRMALSFDVITAADKYGSWQELRATLEDHEHRITTYWTMPMEKVGLYTEPYAERFAAELLDYFLQSRPMA